MDTPARVPARIGRPPGCTCGECSRCKHAAYMREWYRAKTPEARRAIVEARDPERVRLSDRRRAVRPRRIAQTTRNTARWRKEHPERARAHSRVAYALKTGRLVRKPCEVCGAVKVHAHHDDYSRPLDVRWLCPLHHAKERRHG